MSDDPKAVARRIVMQVLREAVAEGGPKGEAAKAEIDHRLEKAMEGFKKAFRAFGQVARDTALSFMKIKEVFDGLQPNEEQHPAP